MYLNESISSELFDYIRKYAMTEIGKRLANLEFPEGSIEIGSVNLQYEEVN